LKVQFIAEDTEKNLATDGAQMDTDEEEKEVACDTGVLRVLGISSTGETPVSQQLL
jgi:hypothetical protein